MIDLTVKTLDSLNHVFSVEDDQITVRGFKEYIAESVAVPADSQRLIYCGRVLQDEKKLNDYDVNGKVIHLVQRAPPQSTQQSNSGGQTQNRQNWQNSQRPQYRFTRTQMHGNAMYLGTAMSVPAEIVEGHGIPQLSNSLSGSRLQLAGRMLDRINELLDRLEDPTVPPLHPTPSELNQSTAQQQQTQAQEPEVEQNENNDLPRDDGGVRFAEAAAAAITAALSAAGARAVTLFRGGNYNGANGRSTSDIDNESDVQAQPQPQAQTQQQQQRATTGAQGATDAGATSSNAGQNRRAQQQDLPRPPQMAELLQRMYDTQYRLRPHLERYSMLMLLDPRHPPGREPNPTADCQRLVDGVSEILHLMAHSCHALSDIIVDMSQRPPRNLRCRPILVQHSAFLQPSIPIQVEAHISLNGRTATSNSNDETSDSGTQQTQQPDNAEPAATPPRNSNADDGSQERESDSTTQAERPQAEQGQSPFSTVFNLPNNVEVLMEVSSENNIDGGSGSEQTASSNDNNNGNTRRNMNSFPPGYLLRNFIHTMAAAQMAQSGMNMNARNPPSTTAGTQNIFSSMDSGSTNTSQSTQARGNTGTHPTTATQTRSTSRPHVFHHHAHPVGFGMSIGLGLEFDPYLPCNSHHVYRTSTNAAAPNTTTATASSQTTQTTTSDAQNQTSQTATTSTTTTSATPTNTTSTNTETTSSNPSVNSSQPSQSAGAQSQTDINIPVDGDNIASNLMEDTRNMMMALGDQVRVGMLSESSMGMNLTLAGLFENVGFPMDLFGASGENSFLTDLFITVTRNMSVDGLIRLRNGLWGPLSRLRWPLQVFLQDTFPNASSPSALQEQVIDRLLSQLRPHIRDILASEEISNRIDPNVDLCATIESLIVRHTRNILTILFDNEIDNAVFGREMLKIITNLCTQFWIILRHTLRGVEAGMEAIATRFMHLSDSHVALTQWALETFINSFRTYLSSLPQPPDTEITPLLVYKDAPSSQQSTTVSSASTRQPAQPPEDEPMEIESLEQQPVRERPVLEDREEILGTFPGHEVLPSDWVPIIARDGVRQRRQLETLMPKAACMTTCSDAYLGGLPNKRRKLVEQQKPRLLVSPTPNHNSTIAASVERLIREGVGRAGVEEVEGAAVAVAADPAVQRAFGQAIRECLFPYRYGTPDFPDPSRFPNATKYFANQDRPPK